MLRDRLPRDVEVRGDPPRGQFLVADEMQDLASSGLGDGINGCLHVNVSIYYRNLTLAQVYAFILLFRQSTIEGVEMKMRRHTKAVALVAASAVLATALGSFGSASAQSGPATRLCTWGGTPANPTGIVTLEPGLTNTPSAGPIAVHAWGPLEGPGCNGTMIFDGIARSGAGCLSGTIFEGSVYGVPGVTRLFGPGWGPQVQEFLYDRHGNIVGSDQPNVKVEGNSAPNSNAMDCNTPQGFRRAPFSSTVELY